MCGDLYYEDFSKSVAQIMMISPLEIAVAGRRLRFGPTRIITDHLFNKKATLASLFVHHPPAEIEGLLGPINAPVQKDLESLTP